MYHLFILYIIRETIKEIKIANIMPLPELCMRE